MLTSACLLLFIELRERGLSRGYGFDLLKSWGERGEFSIIYQEMTRCHHFESMILVLIESKEKRAQNLQAKVQ